MQWKSEMRQCVQDLVTCHPEERMNDYALIFLDHTGQRRELLTYIDLKTRCLAAARQMRHRTNPGDVVLIAIEDQCQFVIGFLPACWPDVSQLPYRRFAIKTTSRLLAVSGRLCRPGMPQSCYCR